MNQSQPQPQPTMFSGGQELATMFVSSDLPSLSWDDGICKLYGESSNLSSIEFKVYEQRQIGTTIIAFVSSPFCTRQYLQAGLVSSATLGEDFLFRFVSTKVNPSFSINRAALDLFHSLQVELSPLKDQAQQYVKANSSRLIVTGHSLGGSIATLFTLWLLENISPKENKRPLCITFGSPPIGDNGFQQAILERPTWNSCFLHVASTKDPIPKLFVSPQNAVPTGSTFLYKPSGTFLLCSESGCACFEEPESILDLMVATGSDSVGTQGPSEGLQMMIDYGDILGKLKKRAICTGVSGFGDWVATPLQTGIAIQIEAIKAERTQQPQEIGDPNSLINKIAKRAEDLVSRKRNAFDPNKKLNEMKISMAYVEWYKKVSVSRGGYYDAFKNMEFVSREELKMRAQIVKRKGILNQYWANMVKEVEKMPQMEGAFFRKRWIRSGTNYRRLVEPLDIADWYKNGNRDYLAQRPEHYLLLEKWQKESPEEQHNQARTVACSLTEDSHFWAYIEEAILLINGETSPRVELLDNLVHFENYVWHLIEKYAVSTEIFLSQSSFMQWWIEYEQIRGTCYHSPLVDFMRNREYERYK